MLEIVQVETEVQLQQVRDLIQEYTTWDLGVTRQFGLDVVEALVDFHYKDTEDYLPGEFVPPEGRLLLALVQGQAAGCGALRSWSAEVGEIKRLYVRPVFRGKGVGKTLLQTLIEAGRTAGYTRLRLETTTFMQEAQALYKSLGFHDIAPYYEIPDALKPISVFMECPLSER